MCNRPVGRAITQDPPVTPAELTTRAAVRTAATAAATPAEPSLAELAAGRVLDELGAVRERLETKFTPERLAAGKYSPEDRRVRAFRAELLRLRTLLDLSAPGFPAAEGKDTFAQMRKVLDEGYERLGQYKDLYTSMPGRSTRYDPVELAKAQRAVEKWRNSLGAKKLDRWESYFQTAPELEGPVRQSAGVSRLFWQGVEPDLQASGLENLRLLSDDLAARALKNLKRARKLQNPAAPEAEDVFHEARKALRSLIALHELYPELSRRGETKALGGLRRTFDRMGRVHDRMDGLRRLRAADKPTTAQVKAVKRGYRELLGWLNANAPERNLERFLR